ncbi:MAG: NAD(P)H-hydrate dehydratase [Armatimonadota bacterium]
MKLANAQQMREVDRRAIEDCGLPSLVLMENAALAICAGVVELLTERGGRCVKVVAGKGNNGGDGLAVARQLLCRGYEVEVLLLAEPTELSGDADTNCQAAQKLGVKVSVVSSDEPLETLAERLAPADVVVDAILGTGVTGEVKGLARRGIEAIRRIPPERVVAVDMPSGIDSDTGQVLGAAVEACRTITLGLPKVGLYCYPGAAHSGEVIVDPIGLPSSLLAENDIRTHLTTAEECRAALPPRRPDAHKGDCGRVLVVAGSAGMSGAASLCGLGALRAGAGLVTVATPAGVNAILEVKLTEVMTAPLPETSDQAIGLAAEPILMDMSEEAEVLVIGPGVSQASQTQRVVRRLVESVDKPIVVDADGLNALAGDLAAVTERSAPAVLTPHPGELSRLVGKPINKIQADRLTAARELAEQVGAVVVLKGAATVVADPGGVAHVNPTGNEGMASGGTGDVLAGLIGGLAAQGAGVYEAAVAGVYLHGLAGDLAAQPNSRAMIAGDLLGSMRDALAVVEGLE